MTDPGPRPDSPLRVAVAQPRVVDYAIDENVAEHARLVEAAQAGLVVFPEMSLTGYRFDAPSVSVDSPQLEPLSRACAGTGSTVLAGAPVAGPTDGTRHIATLVIDGHGARVGYHKMYLGADEAAHFCPGGEPARVQVAELRVGLAICKDSGTPVHAQATAALGIDVYAAGVVEDDRAEVDRRARTIATTHRVWVAVAAFAGPTGEGFDSTSAHSVIVAPDGSVAAQAGAEPGTLVVAEVF